MYAGHLPANALRNISTILRCRFHGMPVFSHRLQVPESIPSCRAASLTVQPIARRSAASCSEWLVGFGKGSYPKNPIILGMASIGGFLFPFSQLRTVKAFTPRHSPAPFWVSLSSRRRFRICSPSVLGSKSVSLGFSALRVTGRHGKKATRPCPCGFLGHYSGKCHCTPDQVTRNRISGPLLDRIDLHIEVPAVPEKDLGSRQSGESSAAIRERVTAARSRQIARQGKPNARLSVKEIGEHCIAEADADQLARKAISALGLSARAYHRILKVARTVADLAGASGISTTHEAEAVQ